MSDLAAIIGAAGGLAATFGGGVAFIWGKVDARMAKLEAEQAECERRADRAKDRSAVQLTVIELLWQEVKRLAPEMTTPVLDRAQKLMDGLKKEPGE